MASAAPAKTRLRGQELRNDLTTKVKALPAAKAADFKHPKAHKPETIDPELHKVAPKELVAVLVRNGGAKVIQSPSGGPQSPTSKVPYIIEFVPTFDHQKAVGKPRGRAAAAATSRQDSQVSPEALAALLKGLQDGTKAKLAASLKDANAKVAEAKKAIAAADGDELVGASSRLASALKERANAETETSIVVLTEMEAREGDYETQARPIIRMLKAHFQGRRAKATA